MAKQVKIDEKDKKEFTPKCPGCKAPVTEISIWRRERQFNKAPVMLEFFCCPKCGTILNADIIFPEEVAAAQDSQIITPNSGFKPN